MITNTIPSIIWDAKKFHWKPFLRGKFETLEGCPNWLYAVLAQIKASGQSQEDIIIVSNRRYQYAIKFSGGDIQIFSKRNS